MRTLMTVLSALVLMAVPHRSSRIFQHPEEPIAPYGDGVDLVGESEPPTEPPAEPEWARGVAGEPLEHALGCLARLAFEAADALESTRGRWSRRGRRSGPGPENLRYWAQRALDLYAPRRASVIAALDAEVVRQGRVGPEPTSDEWHR